jgi:hypothetical protein
MLIARGKHKKLCKERSAEIHDEALFKDPPPKEDCPICFLPMPLKLIYCASLPDATVSSVPIYEFAKAHEEFATEGMEEYYACCGKTICRGCDYTFRRSGNVRRCVHFAIPTEQAKHVMSRLKRL